MFTGIGPVRPPQISILAAAKLQVLAAKLPVAPPQSSLRLRCEPLCGSPQISLWRTAKLRVASQSDDARAFSVVNMSIAAYRRQRGATARRRRHVLARLSYTSGRHEVAHLLYIGTLYGDGAAAYVAAELCPFCSASSSRAGSGSHPAARASDEGCGGAEVTSAMLR